MSGPMLRPEFAVLRTISTRWEDEDVYGHINNVVYYSFFDTAVNGYLIDSTGMDVRNLDAVGVVAETGCQFFRQLRYPGDVQVGLSVTKLGTSSIVYRLGVFQGRDDSQTDDSQTDDPAAIGRFVHVYVRGPDREVTPVPDEIRAAVAPLVQKA